MRLEDSSQEVQYAVKRGWHDMVRTLLDTGVPMPQVRSHEYGRCSPWQTILDHCTDLPTCVRFCELEGTVVDGAV